MTLRDSLSQYANMGQLQSESYHNCYHCKVPRDAVGLLGQQVSDGVGLSRSQIGHRVGTVVKRTRCESRKLPRVSVREGNHHSVWRQIWKTCEGICGETGFRLLTIRDYE